LEFGAGGDLLAACPEKSGKRPVGRVKRENGNFERYFIVRDTGCTDVNWIKVAQVIAQCLALMGTVVEKF